MARAIDLAERKSRLNPYPMLSPTPRPGSASVSKLARREPRSRTPSRPASSPAGPCTAEVRDLLAKSIGGQAVLGDVDRGVARFRRLAWYQDGDRTVRIANAA